MTDVSRKEVALCALKACRFGGRLAISDTLGPIEGPQGMSELIYILRPLGGALNRRGLRQIPGQVGQEPLVTIDLVGWRRLK